MLFVQQKKLAQHVHSHFSSQELEQLFCLREVEEEAYTLCRWMRAAKFDSNLVLQRLKDNRPGFEQAKANHFYPGVKRTKFCLI